MDYSVLQAILINYVPVVTVLIGFIASCFGFLKNLKKCDVTTIKEQLKDESSYLYKQIDELLYTVKVLMQENETLKNQNNELLSELKRIADYEYKE